MIVGIGTDIVGIERLARLREERGDRFLELVFTPAELEHCNIKQFKESEVGYILDR